MSSNPKIRILIVDDHKIIREALEKSLNEVTDFEVVATLESGKEAKAFLSDPNNGTIDVVLMDLIMNDEVGQGELSGLNAAKFIQENLFVRGVREIKIIIITQLMDGMVIEKAYNMNVHSFLHKDVGSEEIIRVVRLVMNEKMYYPMEIMQLMQEHKMKAHDPESQEIRLTPTEKEILVMISQGLKTREIAESRGVGVDGIEAHRRNIMRKMGAKNMAQMITIAFEKGILAKFA